MRLPLLLLLLYAVLAVSERRKPVAPAPRSKGQPDDWIRRSRPLPVTDNDVLDDTKNPSSLLELGSDIHDEDVDASLVLMAKSKRIPLSLLIQLNDIDDVDELFDRVIEPTQRYKRRGLKSATEVVKRGGGGGGGRKHRKPMTRSQNETLGEEDNESESRPNGFGAIFDRRSFCNPRRQPIKIPQPADPTLIYQPMCIQVDRCGGCCSHELFECVPLLTRNTTRKVMALRYPHAGSEYFVYESVARVHVERHSKCQCQCKIQPEDCGPRHIYDRDNCRCVCAATEGHLKCKDNQVWIASECRCRCQEYGECSTGTYFDTRMCRCRAPGEILTQNKIVKNQLTKSFH